MSHFSDDDCQYAQDVWKAFGIRSMGGCHELCLKTDEFPLVDVFEEFGITCFKAYWPDQAWHCTSLELPWDAVFKMTKMDLEF
jgi:hypothetical protein